MKKMKIKIKHPGALHAKTDTPKGKKIPMKKIKEEEHSKNLHTRKQAQFADNARKFNHKKGGRKS